MLNTAMTTRSDNLVTPVLRSCRSQGAAAGHIMIGLAQHAARQPGASPEVISTARRLQEWQRASQNRHQSAPRHRATTIGE